MAKKPRMEYTTERDFIKSSFNGLTAAIGSYLRAYREQKLQIGWSDLSKITGEKDILNMERGKRFPIDKNRLQKTLKALKVENVESLSKFMVSLEEFRKVLKRGRFKL